MSPKPQAVPPLDFDPDDVTDHGTTNPRVRELTDPDAYVMLGKLASAVARCESTVIEASARWAQDRAELLKLWKEDRDEARAARRKLARSARTTGGLTVGVVGAIQAIVYLLQHSGLIK